MCRGGADHHALTSDTAAAEGSPRSTTAQARPGGLELDRLVALCPPCHAQTDAPYLHGRLVVMPCGGGRFIFELWEDRARRRAAWSRGERVLVSEYHGASKRARPPHRRAEDAGGHSYRGSKICSGLTVITLPHQPPPGRR